MIELTVWPPIDGVSTWLFPYLSNGLCVPFPSNIVGCSFIDTVVVDQIVFKLKLNS
jgi:hypothetical protein